jgi:hypothetical protein
MIAATDMHATEEVLEEVFSVRSMPRLYNEDQLPLPVSQDYSLEMAGRQVGGWCEMTASL